MAGRIYFQIIAFFVFFVVVVVFFFNPGVKKAT